MIKSWEYVKMLDKEGIINFLKENNFSNAPSRLSVIGYKYREDLQKLLCMHMSMIKSPDFVNLLPEIKKIETKMKAIQRWYDKEVAKSL